MMNYADKNKIEQMCSNNPQSGFCSVINPVTTYHEKKIGKILYRVTSVYMGKFELCKALEDLTVKKILQDEIAVAHNR